MSAYLERLAASVRNPTTGIVPLVRPVYLAPPVEQDATSTALEPLEDEAVAPTTVSAAESRPDERSRTAPPSGSPPAVPPPASFEPLLPEVPAPEVIAPTAVAEPQAQDDQLASVEVDPAVPVEATRLREDARLTPALPSDSVHVTRGRASAAPMARTPPAPDAAITGLPARIGLSSPGSLDAGRSGQRAPDEIQIHIGRVEVVAVPPAEPAPPPSRRERKSLDLDRYLQNGG